MEELQRPERVLIVGAHPDDPDAACGGTVALWASQGTAIWYVVVTSGDKGVPEDELDVNEFVKVREAEQLESARFLGAEGVTFLHWLDGEVFDSLELRERITLEIRRFQPDTIMTHDPLTRMYRQHPDHRAVGFATLHSAFPSSRLMSFFPEHASQGLGVHSVSQALLYASDQPDTFINIEPVFDRKVEALELHQSQHLAFYGDFRGRVERRARQAGARAGNMNLAESFLYVDLD